MCELAYVVSQTMQPSEMPGCARHWARFACRVERILYENGEAGPAGGKPALLVLEPTNPRTNLFRYVYTTEINVYLVCMLHSLGGVLVSGCLFFYWL